MNESPNLDAWQSIMDLAFTKIDRRLLNLDLELEFNRKYFSNVQKFEEFDWMNKNLLIQYHDHIVLIKLHLAKIIEIRKDFLKFENLIRVDEIVEEDQ